MLDISIISGLVAMFSWGIADFIQSKVVRQMGSYKTMYIGNIVWIIFVLPFAFFISLKISITNLILLFVGSVMQVFAIYNFYQSMKIGEVSIVTPISGSYSIITVLMLLLLLGQKLNLMTISAIFILIIGIILTSTDLKKIKHIHTVKGVKEAVIALLMWGSYFFFVEVVAKDITFFLHFPATDGLTVFFYSGVFIGFSSLIFSILHKGQTKLRDLKKNNIFWFVLVAQLIYTVAWAVINYGVSVGNTALITTISSLYPAITVILALIFYKEKLVLNQKIGILIILIGLILISL
ncbi:EamA family transporter [archaeon]|jgi:drug/metabolite transporter (DMT)-like permease|nr:EamA family transporter [archaeon]MBT4022899.1 EamA family transporter [archaeon]MBT4272546.1 EamA family transporter [archaeon]MBT4460386.1 EamA family transporter [archaeon]MBT4859017.1 EamA family transporter [archaeon]